MKCTGPPPVCIDHLVNLFHQTKGLSEGNNDLLVVRYRGATRWMPQLQRACKFISSRLFFEVQANIYLTPAINFSSPPHFDTHHIFVAQVQGDKLWELYDCDYPMPRPHDHFSTLDISLGPQTNAIELRRGSVLYLPRGLAHRPVSLTDSVHVSIGCKLLSMCEVIELLCDYVGRVDPRMRVHIPLDPNTGDVDEKAFSDKMTLCLEIIGSHHSEVAAFLSSRMKAGEGAS